MAFNPSPKVRAAADVARKFEKDQVVIIMVDHSNNTLEYASYGKTGRLCNEARKLADSLYKSAMNYFQAL